MKGEMTTFTLKGRVSQAVGVTDRLGTGNWPWTLLQRVIPVEQELR